VAAHRRGIELISIKEEARRLVDQLPENPTWDDLMHEIYVRQSIEKGLADSEAGRTTSCRRSAREVWSQQVKVELTDNALEQLWAIHDFKHDG
jgi:hypothetical protein